MIPEKIEKLQRGVCPIYEPGAETQLSDGLRSGRLRFTCDVKEAVEHGDLIFIAVGTPEAPDGSSDLKYVYSAADEIADYMQGYKLVVDNRSGGHRSGVEAEDVRPFEILEQGYSL